MAEYLTNTTDLTKVASAIREKGGTSAPLVYPDGFVTAIQAIQTGSSGSKTVSFSGASPDSPATITYVSSNTMKSVNIGGGADITSVEITVDVNTSIYVNTERMHAPFYPTVSGATLVPGAIVNSGGKYVYVYAMYKVD